MTRAIVAGSVTAALVILGPLVLRPVPVTAAQVGANPRAFLQAYCITCHSQQLKSRGAVPVAFDTLDLSHGERRREDVGVASCGRCGPVSCRRLACRVPTRRRTSIPGLARRRARSRRASESESGTDRAAPPAEPDGIPERGPRPARSRHRRRVPAAGRRRELRLRQHRGRAEALADADGAVSGGGAEDQPRGASASRRRFRRSTISASPTICAQDDRLPGQLFGTRGGDDDPLHLPDGRAVHDSRAAGRAISTNRCRSTPRRSSSK